MASSHLYRIASTVTSGAGNPFTHSFTVQYGDTVLVVPIIVGSGTSRTGGAPSYAGILLTQAGVEQKAAAAPETVIELWYLLNPPVGTANISIPNSGVLTLRTCGIAAQSTTGNSVFNAANGANGTSTNPTTSVTTTKDGCFVVAIVGSGAQTWAPTGRSGTQIFDTDYGTFGGGAQYVLQAVAGSQATDWTFGTSEDWAICNAAFEPGKGRFSNNWQAFGGSGFVPDRVR